jgi:checkpoint serine/threonine-protein kinase
MDHLSTPRVATQQLVDATPITDYTVIESQKENIRPLPTGRSAATLRALFAKDDEAEKVIQEGHIRHQKDIEEAERRDREGEDMMDGSTDLLDVYNKCIGLLDPSEDETDDRYILFTVQHHPTSASHLVPLLESTSRRFIDDARYAQDIRNLKMWVMYTRHVERREEVFAYLESKDVGTKHALFYEEWAAALEGLGRYVMVLNHQT